MPEQFDITENLDRASRTAYPYLVILQHGQAESAATIVAAPVALPPPNAIASRLHPQIEVNGRRYAIFVAQLAAIPKRQVGPVIGNLENERYAIIAALDMLFTGI